VASRDNMASALAFALFSESFGAGLNDTEFFRIFGYELSDFEGYNPRYVRQGFMQFAIWYYEYAAAFAEDNDFSLDALNSWRREHVNLGQRRELMHLHEYLVRHSEERFRSVYIDMLRTINGLMDVYRDSSPGESITALSLVQRVNAYGNMTITVSYEGYTPTLTSLTLTWDGSNEVEVFRNNDNNDPINSGDPVSNGETLIVVISEGAGPVTFTLTDNENFFLANGSIRARCFGRWGC